MWSLKIEEKATVFHYNAACKIWMRKRIHNFYTNLRIIYFLVHSISLAKIIPGLFDYIFIWIRGWQCSCVSDICFLYDKSFRDMIRSSSWQLKVNLTDNGRKKPICRYRSVTTCCWVKVSGFLSEERTDLGTVGDSNCVSAKMKKQLF